MDPSAVHFHIEDVPITGSGMSIKKIKGTKCLFQKKYWRKIRNADCLVESALESRSAFHSVGLWSYRARGWLSLRPVQYVSAPTDLVIGSLCVQYSASLLLPSARLARLASSAVRLCSYRARVWLALRPVQCISAPTEHGISSLCIQCSASVLLPTVWLARFASSTVCPCSWRACDWLALHPVQCGCAHTKRVIGSLCIQCSVCLLLPSLRLARFASSAVRVCP
jgi:hypothetical protein